jgi:twinkle protein
MNEASIIAHDLASATRFHTTAKDHVIRLKETFQRGKQPGETTYIQCLDEILTLRMGYIYCFTGWPGSGKSEFLTQLSVLQGEFKKRKTALFSPESYPVDEYIDTIIHCYLGKSTDKRFPNVCTEKEYDNGIEWTDKYFLFCDWPDTPDIDGILKYFLYLHQVENVSIFVVDPFNSLETTGEESNIAVALKRNLTKVKRFAQQFKVMFWIVEHPKTPNRTEEYEVNPGPRQLFGGTMWWNKVDVLASVHRPNREDKHDRQVIIKTWKVKRQELNGRPGEKIIHFDITSKRYYEDQHCKIHPMVERNLYDDRIDF